MELFSLTSRRDQKSTCRQCGPLGAAIAGTYVAVGFVLAMGFALYMLLHMSPELLQHLLHDVIKCDEFPEYLSRAQNSSAAGNVDYSDQLYLSSTPPVAMSNTSDDNTTASDKSPRNFTRGSLETQSASEEEKLRVFLGIFVMAWNIKQRNLLRMAYGVQASKDADLTVRFVMGALEDGNAYYKTEVERDNATFGDIIVLDCPENVNDGKTFTFFSSLPGIVGPASYDYVMKLDDDSYIRLANLGEHLQPLPRTDLYYGYSLPCGNEDPYTGWMAGAGYLVSWDLVRWIGESPIPRNKSVGVEDKLTRDWFDEGGVAKNRATSFGLFYDHVEHAGDERCAHELRLDSILVHKLKTVDQWHEVLAFFLTDRSSFLHY